MTGVKSIFFFFSLFLFTPLLFVSLFPSAFYICPKGWGLPINGNAQTSKSWINLLFTSYSLQDNGDSSTNAHKTPLSLVYSGGYAWVGGNLADRGSYGSFWSSTPYSAANAHYLSFYSTRLIPQRDINKVYGFTIRCVV
ncbi:hypothetical protein IKF81_02905 [Candidatus Saccharibacteria bacterium]|nr:hypothetical protein [Candidatus Saccharibacteria bacterium]